MTVDKTMVSTSMSLTPDSLSLNMTGTSPTNAYIMNTSMNTSWVTPTSASMSMMKQSMSFTTPSMTPVMEEDAGWAVSRIENSTLVRTIYAFIALFGMSGNLLVCFVLLRVPSLRTRTSQFIVHLAITDFATSFWVIPFHLFPGTPRVPRGFLGELVCRFYVSKYFLWVTVFASVYSLVSITVERYFAVVYPMKYKVYFTLRYSIIIMVACWFVGMVSNSFFFYVYDYKDGACHFIPYPTPGLQKLIGVYIFSLVYFFPISVNLICHARMIRSLKRQARALAGNIHEGNGNKNNEVWQLKVAQDVQRMLFIVVITYMICWAPNQFIFFAFNLGANVDFSAPYYHFSVILALCNSCMNPFIYVFKHREFRVGIAQAFGCVRQVGGGVRVRPAGGTNDDRRGVAGPVAAEAGMVDQHRQQQRQSHHHRPSSNAWTKSGSCQETMTTGVTEGSL